MSRVLIIATSRKTRGGITSVVKAHETGPQWERYHCRWIETHRDDSAIIKLWYLFTAIIETLVIMPFYDIVHIHFSEPKSAMRKTLFFRMAKIYRKKTIVHFHSFSTETTINSIYRPRYEYIFTSADRVVVLSEYWQKAICKEFGLKEEKVKILYNPCPTIPLQETREKKANNILYAGTVTARKGYTDMIKAFAKIAHNHKDWKIVFAGNGEVEQGKKLSAELGISNQTIFLGWVSGEEKDKAFHNASILCLPSYAEGFPMAVLDAWAYGLPVITTPVGGIPDVAKDGENMLLFNPGDIDKLAEQMEKMIDDTNFRHHISEASVNFAKFKFNINTINEQLGQLYQDVCNE